MNCSKIIALKIRQEKSKIFILKLAFDEISLHIDFSQGSSHLQQNLIRYCLYALLAHQSTFSIIKNRIFSSYNQIMMKQLYILVGLLTVLTVSIPYHQQLALVNSLEVGRNEDPNDWTCIGCDESNLPINTYIIEEKSKEIRASLAVYEEYTVLAFRYTANVKNVYQDVVYAVQKQDDNAPQGCKVQKAYDSMWESIRQDVIKGLKSHDHTKRLIITGISLGGGLAALSYVDIRATKQFENVEVITFGAPRVGNKKWAAWFDSITTSTRIYIREDPINFLPKCLTLLCNYGYIGQPVVCYPERKTCECKANDDVKMNEIQSAISFIGKQVFEHRNEIKSGNLNGINDHIYGYKEIKDYTFVC